MTMLRKFPIPANFHYPDIELQLPAPVATTIPPDETAPSATSGAFGSIGGVRIAPLADGTLLIENTLGTGAREPNLFLELALAEECAWEPASPSGAVLNCWSAGPWRLERAGADGRMRLFHDKPRTTDISTKPFHPLLSTPPRPFGHASARRAILFNYDDQTAPVYGLGEKTGGLDKARQSYTFWNVDVVADHPDSAHSDGFDPSYVSIPWLITHNHGQWYGVLQATVGRSWIHTGMVPAGDRRFCPELGLRSEDEPVVMFCSEDEPLRLVIIPGRNMAEIVEKMTAITGRHPRPPRWALGYHQCRWGYRTIEEYERVARRLQEARIPACALWLDIDYMDGWRVFTWDQKAFPDHRRQQTFDSLRRSGTRVVTIVDPGIKREPGNPMHDEFHQQGLLCTTEEGVPYVGAVWPGATVFPDFAAEAARARWADLVSQWVEGGVDGIWNDMNDPSTGPITDEEMRFDHGRLSHNAGHNAYADLMARATFDGMVRARPNQRPFILTRSGMTGIQRHAAVWTGDNFSNLAHLKMSIPQTLNLGLSGVAFNGPDVGGFCGDTTEPLMVEWTLAGFLFPFFRNHSASNTRWQEPYMFSPDAEDVIRKAINTRLKLMPMIESIFAEHASNGAPVMRPMAWHDPSPDMARLSDQFLVGRDILAAPFLDPESRSREVVLPGGWWFDLSEGQWVEGGRTITYSRPKRPQPVLFIRDGALLPAWEGTEFPADGSGSGRLDLHVFLHSETVANGRLIEDDGLTVDGPATWRALSFSMDDSRLGVRALSLGHPGAASTARVLFHGASPGGASPTPDPWPFHQRTVLAITATLPA